MYIPLFLHLYYKYKKILSDVFFKTIDKDSKFVKNKHKYEAITLNINFIETKLNNVIKNI